MRWRTLADLPAPGERPSHVLHRDAEKRGAMGEAAQIAEEAGVSARALAQ